MTEHKLDHNARLLGQLAVTTVLWAGPFLVTKTEAFGHPGGLAMRIALVVLGVGGFLPVVYR